MELKAQKRNIKEKKAQVLRHEGFLPAILYGHKIASQPLTLNAKDFSKVFRQAGESELVDLQIEEEKPVKVLIKDIQRDPVSDVLIHTDLYQVELTEKVTTKVPIRFSGESPAVKSGQALLLTLLTEVEVEALPLDLPAEINLDVSPLQNIGDHLAVKDLPLNREKVAVHHKPEDIVVKLDYPEMKEEEVKEEVTPEQVEITKEKKEEAGEEGEAASDADKVGGKKGEVAEEKGERGTANPSSR